MKVIPSSKLWPEKCPRCGADFSMGQIMSMFNTDSICMNCADKERAHPKYEEAREAEVAACKRGDYNFPGIGKPSDL